MRKNKKKLKKRLRHFPNTRYYEIQDSLFKYFGLFCTFFGLLVLVVLLVDVSVRGLSRLDWDFIFSFPSSMAESAGIYAAWTGTLWIMVLTGMIAFPIGVGA